MLRVSRICLKIFIILVFCLIKGIKSENITKLINVEVLSEVKLNEQIVYMKRYIRVLNVGPTPINRYFYIIEEPEMHFITFQNVKGTKLSVEKTKMDSLTGYEVILDSEVFENEHYEILVNLYYLNKITPAQKTRFLEEDQLVVFEGNMIFFSPYDTNFCKTDYIIHNDMIVEVSNVSTSASNTKQRYEFFDVKPYTIELVQFLFINNNAFLTIKNLDRTIYVSHFGKIFIEDHVTLENNGDTLIF